MNRIVFDIEGNGLSELVLGKKGVSVPEGDTVHCMVCLDLDSDTVKTFGPSEIEEGVQMLREADLLVGHNITMYDIPLLERLYGKIPTDTIDTLIISKLMYPDRNQHPLGGNSLEMWGRALGVYKEEYAGGWEVFSEEMLEYCVQDTQVNKAIYLEQLEYIMTHEKIISLEHILSKIIATQTGNGFGFDLKAAIELDHTLQKRKTVIENGFERVFPTKIIERYSDKTGKKLKDQVIKFNPGSRKQIAERLGDKYNWKPPLTDKGNPKVDESVLKKLNFPEAKVLVEYFNIIKLMGQVTDWITRASNSRDGRIHGSINPQGTVTGRMTANQPNLQQVSGDPRARRLFVPREGWLQVGIDAKGLEARMLGNRMYPFDKGAYGKIITEKDIHSENQRLAGLSNRNDAKTFFYGFIYGAGDARIGEIVGKSSYMGRKLKKQFLDGLPALKKVIDDCKFQVKKLGKISLLDGRLVPCRSAHAALNVQLQGDGAIVMKLAQCIFDRKIKKKKYQDRVKFMATVHDEWQMECVPELAEEVGQMGCDSITEAGERLGCSIALEGDYRIGKDWSECH
jgi:DNA polymerase I-like protein with 3'-5' exonuclease and polymerase domains